jgi:hypothetical protein
MARGNPNAVHVNWQTEIGEVIKSIILSTTPYGVATYHGKIILEHLKNEIINAFNAQGKDGKTIYNKWYKEWSMFRVEQNAKKEQRERKKFEKRKQAYISLDCSPEKAEELATNFPNEKPLTVLRTISYVKQNNRPEQNEERKETDSQLAELNKKRIEEEEAVQYLNNELDKYKAQSPEKRNNAGMKRTEKRLKDAKTRLEEINLQIKQLE